MAFEIKFRPKTRTTPAASISSFETVATCSASFVCLQTGSFTLERVGFQDITPLSLLVGIAALAIFLPIFLRIPNRGVGSSKRLRRVWILTLALIAGVATSMLWGPPGDYSPQLFLLGSMAMGLTLAYPALRLRPHESIIVFSWLFALAGVAFAILGLIAGGDRVSVLGGGPNTYARIVGAGSLAAIYLYQRGRPGVLLLSVPLQMGALIASGSRGGLAGVMIGYLVLFLSTIGRRMIPWARVVVGTVAAVLALALIFTNIVSEVVQTWQDRFVKLTFEQRYLSGRDSLWAEGMDYLEGNPWVGGGFGGFEDHIGRPSYPHNLVLDVGVRTGLLGLVILAVLLAVALRIPNLRSLGPEGTFSLSIFLVFFVSSMASGWFFDSRFAWLALMMFASCIDEIQPVRPEE